MPFENKTERPDKQREQRVNETSRLLDRFFIRVILNKFTIYSLNRVYVNGIAVKFIVESGAGSTLMDKDAYNSLQQQRPNHEITSLKVVLVGRKHR
jgi:hypothetical protein